MRSRLILIGCAALALAALPARAAVVDRILATVDGDPVTLYELDTFAAKMHGQQGSSQDQLLDMLITDRLLQKEVSDKGIVVRDEDIDQYIQSIKDRNHINDDQLKQALSAQGMTMEGYRKQVREEIQKAQLINREIRGKVNVTPEEVERYYKAHLQDYSTPERLHLRHILLRLPPDASGAQVSATMAKAEDIYQRLEKGADFATMAREYSEDPAGKDGGDLGWMHLGEMLEPIEKAAMALKPGEISKPVRSSVGIHIIKLEAREGASHEPLDKLAAGIKEQLYNAALEDRYQKWLTEELRKRHVVEMVQ